MGNGASLDQNRVQEIQERTGLPRPELERLLKKFRTEIALDKKLQAQKADEGSQQSIPINAHHMTLSSATRQSETQGDDLLPIRALRLLPDLAFGGHGGAWGVVERRFLDKDGTGFITFDHFLAMFVLFGPHVPSNQKTRHLFDLLCGKDILSIAASCGTNASSAASSSSRATPLSSTSGDGNVDDSSQLLPRVELEALVFAALGPRHVPDAVIHTMVESCFRQQNTDLGSNSGDSREVNRDHIQCDALTFDVFNTLASHMDILTSGTIDI